MTRRTETTTTVLRTRPFTRAATAFGVAVAFAALPPAAVPLAAQAPFEGAVTVRMSPGARGAAPAPAPLVEYLVRGGKVRMNMAGPMGGAAMIVIPQEKKIYMLMAAQNAYAEMTLPDSVAAAATRRAGTADEVKVKRTGRKETIAGLTCEHVEVTTKAGPSDMCVTSELGVLGHLSDAMRQASPAQQALANEFPLKVTLPDGTVPLEVVKVERKRLANDLFTVPGTYSKITMPARRPPG